MRPVISFSECLADSPRFRSELHQNEANLDDLESKLEKMIKLCSVMTDGGRAYVIQQVRHSMHSSITFIKMLKSCFSDSVRL